MIIRCDCDAPATWRFTLDPGGRRGGAIVSGPVCPACLPDVEALGRETRRALTLTALAAP